MKMRQWMAAGTLLLAIGTATAAPQGGAGAASVRQLLAAAHVDDLMQQVAQQMGQQIDVMVKHGMPCLAPGAVSSVLTSPQAVQKMIDLIVPIYRRNFTEQDVKGLLAFYRTPLGQKMLRMQPVIMRESMQAGEQFGREQVEQRIGQLKTEGKLDTAGKCPVAPAKSAPSGH
ncbi:conserved hypothetical protein, secreted [mine drainage metagenome]|uniref:DUF2059 domain-containing protein n=1 Tax=mine drainage metagenome TaxID=410659 RepID=T1BRU5_9ZZZZ